MTAALARSDEYAIRCGSLQGQLDVARLEREEALRIVAELEAACADNAAVRDGFVRLRVALGGDR